MDSTRYADPVQNCTRLGCLLQASCLGQIGNKTPVAQGFRFLSELIREHPNNTHDCIQTQGVSTRMSMFVIVREGL